MTQDKKQQPIIPDEERKKLFHIIETGNHSEVDEAVLKILQYLKCVNPNSRNLKFWFQDDDNFYEEVGVIDPAGHSYTIRKGMGIMASWSLDYHNGDVFVFLGDRYSPDFDKMAKPMRQVFKVFFEEFSKQKYRQDMQEQQLKRQKKVNNIGLILSCVVVFAATVFSVVSIARTLKEANKKTEQHEQKQYQQTKEKIMQYRDSLQRTMK